jgi:hypothetical protein
MYNTLKAELNPICHLLALLGAHHILHVSRIRVKSVTEVYSIGSQPCVSGTKHIVLYISKYYELSDPT